MLYGIELLPGGKRRDALLREAEVTLIEDSAGRILTFVEEAAGTFESLWQRGDVRAIRKELRTHKLRLLSKLQAGPSVGNDGPRSGAG